MKSSGRLIILILTLLALATSAFALSPREELQQMVAQLQKDPGDNILREKIIKLAVTLRPAPEVPEHANRAFVKGNVFQKDAKDASGYDLAIASYREALRIAPWWGDAYFNLGIALETAGKFNEAIASIKNYMASVSPGSAEAREALNRIYALEAKSELASRQIDVQQAAADTQTGRFVGNWYRIVELGGGRPYRQTFTINRDSHGNWSLSGEMFEQSRIVEIRVEGTEFNFKDQDVRSFFDEGPVEYSGRLSADGRRLQFAFKDLPYTPAQYAVRLKLAGGGPLRPPSNRFGDEEWLKE